MKFANLTIGQRFQFEGKWYTKISPVLADPDDDSGQKFMHRAASVILEEAKEEEKSSGNEPVEIAKIREAFQAFFDDCIDELEMYADSLPEPDLNKLKLKMSNARKKFVEKYLQ